MCKSYRHGKWFVLILTICLIVGPAITVADPPVAELVMEWGSAGDEPGQFHSPIGILIDRRDRVFVSSLNNRVQCFDLKGNYLFGIERTGRDQDALLHSHGMAFDKQGFFYVCDSGNQRILKFKIAD